MLGAMIGDIVGSRFEFDNHLSKEFDLFTPDCFATDDSIMTLAVAKAILETLQSQALPKGLFDTSPAFRQLLQENAVLYMRQLGQPYPDCGFGGMFYRWMYSDAPKPYHSYGNGAAMRVSAAGFMASNFYQAALLSEAVTSVTHNHPEGLKGAEATAIAIYMARTGSSKAQIRKVITENYYPLEATVDEMRPTYRFYETCQDTVPQAITCFLESYSFEDALRTAISLGGDSDTLAAITGGIAEAFYGVPTRLREQALPYLEDTLLAVFEEWEAFFGLDPEKVIYCAVSLFGSVQTYSYRTEDLNIKVGKWVSVPVGPDDVPTIGEVKEVNYYHRGDVPYPLHLTKKIIGIHEEKPPESEDAPLAPWPFAEVVLCREVVNDIRYLVWAEMEEKKLRVRVCESPNWTNHYLWPEEDDYDMDFDRKNTKILFTCLLEEDWDVAELFEKHFSGPKGVEALHKYCTEKEIEYKIVHWD